MKKMLLVLVAFAIMMWAVPVMAAEQKAAKANPAITPALVCQRLEQGQRMTGSKDGSRQGHVMMIQALKDAKQIPLPVRQLSEGCSPGSDSYISFDDISIQRAMLSHVQEAIKAGSMSRRFSPTTS